MTRTRQATSEAVRELRSMARRLDRAARTTASDEWEVGFVAGLRNAAEWCRIRAIAKRERK